MQVLLKTRESSVLIIFPFVFSIDLINDSLSGGKVNINSLIIVILRFITIGVLNECMYHLKHR